MPNNSTFDYSSLTIEQCQQARLSRDQRFDGQFFIAVKTTGIFCRPICPAVLPKEENVQYFANKAQALESGFRPCLRCRPDSAPESWAWKGVETTFIRALKLIDNGELQHSSLTSLAERVGVSDRYLRQLFQRYLGISPKRYAQLQQLMFAKQLLHSSSMSMTDIAFASGFNSVRRFNDAFQQYLSLSPSKIRRQSHHSGVKKSIELPFKGQIDWPFMLAFYARRAIAGVETVTNMHYERQVKINDAFAWFRISKKSEHALVMEFELEDISQLRALVNQVRRMLDLDADTDVIEQHLDKVAPELVHQKGVRIPGTWNAWEAGVRAILGQQVSVTAAIGQLNLLVHTLCEKGSCYFPEPHQIAQADLSFLRMPQSRKDTLHRFAEFMVAQSQVEPSEWLSLKGIGPWTISYAQLRGLSQPDRLLDKDLVVKKALVNFPQLTSETASPWGSYATFHLWNL
ncbi:DNA-3-methyladenine glycosylase 2 family protein [Vibrio sp. S17_S38]|nr:DNA-3-methyladenine glycosylase 2 family protein [Vibrio sp. S17_S38]